MKKRIVCTLLAAVLMMAVFAGCGGSGSGGNTVVVGVATDLKTLDPGYMYEVYGNMISYATYDMLFRMDGNDMSKPVPSLATDYTIDGTNTVYTFTLRDGVKFVSGNPLTSADVVWSIRRVMSLQSNTKDHVAGISDVTAPDDTTVIVTLKEPDASFLTKLASNAFSVVDSKLMQEQGATDSQDMTTDQGKAYLDQHSAGSGAYYVDSWTQNVQLVLKRNPNYWGNTSNVDTIIIKEIPDANTQISMLEKGEIDAALTLNNDNIGQLANQEGIVIKKGQTAITTFLMMNRDASIGNEISNPDVQRAVRYAIDYKGLLALCGDGASLPLNIVPEGFVGSKTKPEDYQDLAKAKELMKQAGYEDGFSINMTVANYDSEGMQWTTIAQKIQNDLKEINIDVNIQTAEIGVVIEDMRQGKLPFLLMHWSPDYYDINNQLVFLPGGMVATERVRWEMDEANARMAELGRLIEGESNYDQRAKYAEELQDLLDADSPYAFLLQHPKSYAVSDKLENVTYNDVAKLQLADLAVKE